MQPSWPPPGPTYATVDDATCPIAEVAWQFMDARTYTRDGSNPDDPLVYAMPRCTDQGYVLTYDGPDSATPNNLAPLCYTIGWGTWTTFGTATMQWNRFHNAQNPICPQGTYLLYVVPNAVAQPDPSRIPPIPSDPTACIRTHPNNMWAQMCSPWQGGLAQSLSVLPAGLVETR
jgi:hypothetical protein